jgi:hypothetical protein
MKRPLALPLHNYARALELLEAEEGLEIDRNAWKRREWRGGEDVGWDLWEMASLYYFRCATHLADLCVSSSPLVLTALHSATLVFT